MKILFISAVILGVFSCAAMAQTQNPAPSSSPNAALSSSPIPSANRSNGQPIEITASKTVEWLRDQKQYIARENVVVTQGAMTINADLLTADYTEGAQSSTEITMLTAEGNVQIKDENNTAYGDKGVYDVPSGVATLTGQNLKLVSPDQTVTATDRMEYHANERMAKAVGNAKVVRAEDTLTADTITAYFKDSNAAAPVAPPQASSAPEKNAAKPVAGNLDRLQADGKVVILTPSEKLYGSKAVYKASTNTAELIGKVRIERGENVLEGERAEVNLTTNISKMFSSNKPGGRVRGVFFPGSEKGADKKKQGASPVPAPFQAPTSPQTAAPLAAPVTAPAPSMPAALSPAPAPVAVSPALPAPVPSAAPATTTPPDLFPGEKTPSSVAPAPVKVSPQVKY